MFWIVGLGISFDCLPLMCESDADAVLLLQLNSQFTHGQTYQAHPIVCAAALEVQQIIQREKLVANVARMSAVLEKRLKEVLGDHPNIGDIRGRGLFRGVSLLLSSHLNHKNHFLPLSTRPPR